MPSALETARASAAARDDFFCALEQYVDARIHYATLDPEWRGDTRVERAGLELALDTLFRSILP